MKNFSQSLKAVCIITLFFFMWSYLPLFQLVAYAATQENQRSKEQPQKAEKQQPAEKLEKLLDALRENTSKAEEKVTKGQDTSSEVESIKARKTEIDAIDTDLRKDFSATEQKLKAANLPKDILSRHYKFVKSYKDNLAELKANIEAVEKAKTPAALATELTKTKKQLAQIKPPKKGKPFDPNKLPSRLVKGQVRAPHLKKEEFEKDFPPLKTKKADGRVENFVAANKDERTRRSNKPVILAYNGPVNDLEILTAVADLPAVQIAQASSSVDPADLSETPEVQFSQVIKDLAAQLKYQPVNFYEWVRNNIEYAPTYGSIQGATMCLQAKLCNDIDTASLLIALFRASNIPAHYAYGTIEVPVEKVMNWVGGVTDPNTSATILATNGIPAKVVISGGTIKAVQLEHAWVEAYVPYGPYSGRLSNLNADKIWVPLDPSYKQYNYTQGIDIKTAVPFDAQTFANQILSTATTNTTDGSVTNVNSTLVQQTMQDYQTQVQNYIQQNYPNATVGNVVGKKEIKKQELGILPVTLPTYKVVQLGGKFAQVSDNLRATISFNIPDPSGMSNGLSYTTSLPQIAGKKITLSFSPATAADLAVIDSFQSGEAPTSLPAYLINLKPELSIDGVSVATGAATTMGAALSWAISFNEPGIGPSNVNNIVIAGQYLGIGVDTGRVETHQLNNLKTKLLSTKSNLESGIYANLTKEDLYGDILYSTIISYFAELDIMDELIARNTNIVRYRAPSIGTFSIVLDSKEVFGVPISISQKGMMMDVDRIMQAVFSKDGDMNKVKQYMLASGANSSALEHSVPEQLYVTPTEPVSGISTIKALKIANDQGVPIYLISQSNIGSIAPQLQIDGNAKADIVNAVNAGKVAIVSKSNITVNGWSGCGYSIIDAATGAGAYMISGGSSGGFFAQINAFSSSVADIISSYADKKYISYDWLNFRKSKIITAMSALSKALVVLGFTIDMVSIVSDTKLSTSQQVEKIIVSTAAVVGMLAAGTAITAIGLQVLPAMLLAVMAYLLITLIALYLTILIEEQSAANYINDRLILAKNSQSKV